MFPFRRFASAVLLMLLAAGCTASPSSPASHAESGLGAASAEATQVSAFDLEVGDCFDTDDVRTVDNVAVADCSTPHQYEVFDVSDVPATDGADFPGDDALTTAADEACRPAFRDYVGIAYDDSEWFLTYIGPSKETWANGDREIVCVVHNEDETQVTGSAEGTRR